MINIFQSVMINELQKIRPKGKDQDKRDVFSIMKFKDSESHFLGINRSGNVALLIRNKNVENKKIVNHEGLNLNILFDSLSIVSLNGIEFEDRFTSLILKEKNSHVISYFIDICKILIQKIGESPDLTLIHKEIRRIKSIFNNVKKGKLKEESGLWGELLFISIQENKNEAISAWHRTENERIDFNDGNCKVEIKTTLSNKRSHIFSLSQLRNNVKENVLIGSIMTIPLEKNSTILNLIDEIEIELNAEQKLNFSLKLSNYLGVIFNQVKLKSFDKKFAINSFELFKANEIPSIELKNIPIHVSGVKFTSDIEPITSNLKLNKHKLY